MAPLFEKGHVVQTIGAQALLMRKMGGDEDAATWLAKTLVARHILGDDGDVCEEDHDANVVAIECGDLRVFSVYDFGEPKDYTMKIHVVTEYDRSLTTVSVADEY